MAPMLFSDEASLRAAERCTLRHRRCRCTSGDGVGVVRVSAAGQRLLLTLPENEGGSGRLAMSKHDGDSDDGHGGDTRDTRDTRCARGPIEDGNVMPCRFYY